MKGQFLLFLFFAPIVYGQYELDLIVTKKGDSVACYIQEERDDSTFFRFKNAGSWLVIGLPDSLVMLKERSTLKQRDLYFQRGTSIILEERKRAMTFDKIQKNGLVLGIDYGWSATASLQRIQPFANHFGALARFGGGYSWAPDPGPVITGELSVLIGGKRSFANIGCGISVPVPKSDSLSYYTIPTISYRFVGFKGLIINAGLGVHVYTSGYEGQKYGVWGWLQPVPILQLGYLIRL